MSGHHDTGTSILAIVTTLIAAFCSTPGRGEPAATAASSSAPAALRLPPVPDGVTQITFTDFFKLPIGRKGLEFTSTIKALDGRRVRILGYMVAQCAPVPGQFMLTATPQSTHEHEYGLCDDLPAATLFVIMQEKQNEIVPHTPGLLLLTGVLSLGAREDPDGRVSTVRLLLDPRGPASAPSGCPAAATQPTADSHTTAPRAGGDTCGHRH